MLESMGFSRDHAKHALKETNNNLERAADWLFNHSGDLDAIMDTAEDDAPAPGRAAPEGTGKYRLKAFISHMGSSAQTGHYICHIKKDGHWAIFNDRKVARSQKEPRELAYVYIYETVAE